MSVITIPKNFTKGEELIIIPRKTFEEFLRVSKKKVYMKLDRDLNNALEDVKAGRLIGPFGSVIEFKKAIKSRRS